MRSRAVFVAATAAALLSIPGVAFGITDAPGSSPPFLRIGASLLGLLVAVILLLETIGVRKFLAGGALADKISYVMLAIVCLAASALAQWAQNFVLGVTLAQVQIASQLLVVFAMVLLTIYFASVRKTLQDYLRAMTGSEMLDADAASREGGDAELG